MVSLPFRVAQFIHRHWQRLPMGRFVPMVLVGLLSGMLLLTGACSRLPSFFTSEGTQSLRLSIDLAQGLDRTGTYRLVGSTSFPNGTNLSLAAVRLLNTLSTNPNLSRRPFIPTAMADYVILDRQLVTVQQGTFDGTLMLTMPSTQAGEMEIWQLKHPDILNVLEPNTDVVFTVTLDPSIQTDKTRLWLRQNLGKASSELERYTTDGELYIQAWSQSGVPIPAVSRKIDVLNEPSSNDERDDKTGQTEEEPASTSDSSDLFSAVRIFRREAVSRKAISTDDAAVSTPDPENNQPQTSVWNRTNAPLPIEAYLQ